MFVIIIFLPKLVADTASEVNTLPPIIRMEIVNQPSLVPLLPIVLGVRECKVWEGRANYFDLAIA